MTLLSEYRGMVKWFGAHYNQEVRFSSAVKCKTGSQVLTSLLNQRRNYIIIIIRNQNEMFISLCGLYGVRAIYLCNALRVVVFTHVQIH